VTAVPGDDHHRNKWLGRGNHPRGHFDATC
jgi:hypothetical protein